MYKRQVYNCLFQPPTLDYSFKNCKDFVDVAYHYLFYSLYSEDDPKEMCIRDRI